MTKDSFASAVVDLRVVISWNQEELGLQHGDLKEQILTFLLDYWNGLCEGLPLKMVRKLQLVWSVVAKWLTGAVAHATLLCSKSCIGWFHFKMLLPCKALKQRLSIAAIPQMGKICHSAILLTGKIRRAVDWQRSMD